MIFIPIWYYFAEAPLITHLSSLNASYNEGNLVSVSCRATGQPDPEVKWIHNGQVMSSGVKTVHFTLSNVNQVDSGIYICMANNNCVGRTEKHVNLVVSCE